jgi:SAM-dependent methyltransferase
MDAKVERWRADHGDARPYAWRLCRQCGNGYPSFQPELPLLAMLWDRDRHHRPEDPAKEAATWRSRRAVSRKGAERSYAMFAKLHRGAPGRFLDIACGLGETVRFFADHGWDARGIDADASLRRFHQEIGVQCEIGQIETAEIDGRFDIIQIAHAIYFITDPRRFLQMLAERLTENGLLCIVLANFMAADDRNLPGYVHSFFPTAHSMRYLLSLAGFQTCLCRPLSGSVYLAARRGRGPLPPVHPGLIRLGYQSKMLRYALFGRPKLWLRDSVKSLRRYVSNKESA